MGNADDAGGGRTRLDQSIDVEFRERFRISGVK